MGINTSGTLPRPIGLTAHVLPTKDQKLASGGPPREIIAQVAHAVSNWPAHAAARGISPANTALVAGQHRLPT